jgi:hypothetical protein
LQWLRQVVEYSVQYDGQNTDTSASNVVQLGSGCFLEEEDDGDQFNATTRGCLITFEIEKDMASPVYVYYQLDNFYQNHRRYVASRSDAQLRGDASASTSDCSPLTTVTNTSKWNSTADEPIDDDTDKEYNLNPCGLIANSLFNGKLVMLPSCRLCWLHPLTTAS